MFGPSEPISQLWVEKYRPKTIDDYVFKNETLKAKVQSWITKGEIPSLLFQGPAGTGKTSLIHVILNSIDAIDQYDVMELNFSDEGIDAVREKILPFVQVGAFGAFKVVILEEFELCSLKGQGSLKRIMEEYSDTVRFILTSNAPNKIIPPIRSRCQEIIIEKHDYDLFTSQILNILIQEGVNLEDDCALQLVDKYVKSCWPDFRRCINTLEGQIVDGKLLEMNETVSSTAGYELRIIEAIATNTLSQARKSIVENIQDDQVDGFFSYLYRNIHLWIPANITAENEDNMTMEIILKIRDAIVKDVSCGDREINMVGLLIELQMIQRNYQ